METYTLKYKINVLFLFHMNIEQQKRIADMIKLMSK